MLMMWHKRCLEAPKKGCENTGRSGAADNFLVTNITIRSAPCHSALFDPGWTLSP